MNNDKKKRSTILIPMVLLALVIVAIFVAIVLGKGCPPIPVPAGEPAPASPAVEAPQVSEHPTVPSVTLPTPVNPAGVGG